VLNLLILNQTALPRMGTLKISPFPGPLMLSGDAEVLTALALSHILSILIISAKSIPGI